MARLADGRRKQEMTPAHQVEQPTQRAKQRDRHDHAYAVVRVDDFLGADSPVEDRITIKKVVRDRETAESEADRLNRLQKEPGVRYLAQITRLEGVCPPPIAGEAGATNRITDH